MIFLHYRKGNGQNYPKSSFLNAFINVEINFFQIGSKYSLELIKLGIFHSTGSNRAVVLTGAKGRIELPLKYGAGPVSIESLVQPTFLLTEIELNWSVIRVLIHFYSAPPGIKTLTSFYFLFEVDNQAEWNVPFRKFSVLSYVKESLIDNKHLKQPPSLWKN